LSEPHVAIIPPDGCLIFTK